MAYAMMRACRELGTTYQTLKFYCNQGLVPKSESKPPPGPKA